jgi:hypothetical protein
MKPQQALRCTGSLTSSYSRKITILVKDLVILKKGKCALSLSHYSSNSKSQGANSKKDILHQLYFSTSSHKRTFFNVGRFSCHFERRLIHPNVSNTHPRSGTASRKDHGCMLTSNSSSTSNFRPMKLAQPSKNTRPDFVSKPTRFCHHTVSSA